MKQVRGADVFRPTEGKMVSVVIASHEAGAMPALRATDIILQMFRRDRAPLGNPAQRDGGHCSLDCPARQRHQYQ